MFATVTLAYYTFKWLNVYDTCPDFSVVWDLNMLSVLCYDLLPCVSCCRTGLMHCKEINLNPAV